MSDLEARQHLLDAGPEGLAAWLERRGEPSYRGDQVWRWIYRRRVVDFGLMTDLPADLRRRLAAAFTILAGRELERRVAADGTMKLLVAWGDGATTESVMIPAAGGGRRTTVCLSTQVGCNVGCRFCASGLGGSERDLTVGEVLEQALRVELELASSGRSVSHAVFMGMGEPLANYAATVTAARRLASPRELGIGRRRITVSTVGLPRQIERLAAEGLGATLAVSLHAPDDELRRRLIPWARGVELDRLLAACRRFRAATGRRVTLEYCLLAGVNDRPADAERLATIARDISAHVNLMLYNPVAALPFARPSPRAARRFRARLEELGAKATLRRSRGLEADAACGQLRRRARAAS